MVGIKRLVPTEKATRILEIYNRYTFEVDSNLTKIQIRWIVGKIFAVPVQSVNTLRLPPTMNRSGRFRNAQCKHRIVSLKKGRKINLQY